MLFKNKDNGQVFDRPDHMKDFLVGQGFEVYGTTEVADVKVAEVVTADGGVDNGERVSGSVGAPKPAKKAAKKV